MEIAAAEEKSVPEEENDALEAPFSSAIVKAVAPKAATRPLLFCCADSSSSESDGGEESNKECPSWTTRLVILRDSSFLGLLPFRLTVAYLDVFFVFLKCLKVSSHLSV